MDAEAISILLVEDTLADIELTKKALKKGKIYNKLFIVRDGQEAIDFLFHHGIYKKSPQPPIPGIILLDINLPLVDGIEVLKQIKTTPKLKRIPTIILTTSKRDEDIINSYDLGVNSYIQKPVDFDKFIDTVKNIELYWILTNTLPKINNKMKL